MKTTLIKSADRGYADHGWLKSNHTFSFAGYHNPNRMGFGMLRVFNDDWVAPSEGFGTHPHANMEIASIPLSGVLSHRDSMGHEQQLVPGEVQVMSAGTGLTHSEYNGSSTEPVEFLQLWVIPNRNGVEPRYDQVAISNSPGITEVVGPHNAGAPLWVHQDAWFSLVRLKAGESAEYSTKLASNGVFLFVIEGACTVGETALSSRDSLAVEDAESIMLQAASDLYALIVDVPMRNATA